MKRVHSQPPTLEGPHFLSFDVETHDWLEDSSVPRNQPEMGKFGHKSPGRRSRCCGFAEVLGLFRAQLYGMNIGLGELKMTAWSF